MPYKVGIIGAARRQQGTGPYIARNFHQLGHRIAGIVGSSKSSSEQTRSDLLNQYGINTEAYTDFSTLAEHHALDIVVISSPPSTHLEYLHQALNDRCHIFCEKPLWWPVNNSDGLSESNYMQEIEDILQLARDHECYLHLNTQWPYTLKDFIRLHPKAISKDGISQFAMYLSPQSTGVNMLVDAASHGLSMLYQLVGDGNIDDIKITQDNQSALIDFDYLHASGCIKSTLGFMQSHETPKPASYQINGFTVKRIVTLPDYQIQLQSDQRTIAIQDPLDTSIKDFLAGIDAQINIDESTLRQGALHLHQLIEHYI